MEVVQGQYLLVSLLEFRQGVDEHDPKIRPFHLGPRQVLSDVIEVQDVRGHEPHRLGVFPELLEIVQGELKVLSEFVFIGLSPELVGQLGDSALIGAGPAPGRRAHGIEAP